MSRHHQAMMSTIAAETKTQDDILDDMSLLTARLHESALVIQDELGKSNAFLDDTLAATDKTGNDLERVNGSIGTLMSKVGGWIRARDRRQNEFGKDEPSSNLFCVFATWAQVNGAGSKICTYIFCLAILLGLGSILYKVMQTS